MKPAARAARKPPEKKLIFNDRYKSAARIVHMRKAAIVNEVNRAPSHMHGAQQA